MLASALDAASNFSIRGVFYVHKAMSLCIYFPIKVMQGLRKPVSYTHLDVYKRQVFPQCTWMYFSLRSILKFVFVLELLIYAHSFYFYLAKIR